jgi:dipeptidyl aminopeptidase/acylaminoacyl peptidase
MQLPAATRLGPYEILAPLGAGGMGEVYRARDHKLDRDVALKVLPRELADDQSALDRFEREAKAVGALSHPNILAIHDYGKISGVAFAITELLEGETLRERIRSGALPPRKAVDIGIQIAHGLAAAHEKGIVHRDLKPENVFVCRDGRVKILDFGLAKQDVMRSSDVSETLTTPVRGATEPGVVLGTVGYMAPEQVRGQPADARSDLFAFGCVLYEMVSGSRAFARESSVETLSSILRDEPPDLEDAAGRPASPALQSIVRRCLEKSPEERFQSARDLAFALAGISGLSAIVSGAATRPRKKLPRGLGTLAIGALVASCLVGAYLVGRGGAPTALPTFDKLTFRRGVVLSARFVPDGKTVVYSARWDGDPLQVFSVRPGTPESRSLGLAGADVLSVASNGDLAVSLRNHTVGAHTRAGTLARLSLGGGEPRELLDRVQWADWDHGGKDLAIVRFVDGKVRLEYPAGHVLYQTSGWLSHPRFSPSGDRIAFLDHPVRADDAGVVAVVDMAGNLKRLTKNWESEWGLAWSARGDEIWFTAAEGNASRSLRAVSLGGRTRELWRTPGGLTLDDVLPDGEALVSLETTRAGARGRGPGDDREIELSWLDYSIPRDLSRDGRTLLFEEGGEGGGPDYAVYLRGTDGSPAVRLGDGSAYTLSPDGRWAVTGTADVPQQLVLLPTGPGQPRTITHDAINHNVTRWMPDGTHVVFFGHAPGKSGRLFLQDLDGSAPRPITPEGTGSTFFAISPDGTRVAVTVEGQNMEIFPIAGGPPTVAKGVAPGEGPICWADDGRSIYVTAVGETSAAVTRVDPASGERTPWMTLAPEDPAGLEAVFPECLTPDGKWYAYAYQRTLSNLYLVKGLR